MMCDISVVTEFLKVRDHLSALGKTIFLQIDVQDLKRKTIKRHQKLS